MPKLRRLSGAEVVAILRRFGFGVASQRGSHIKLKRTGSQGSETLTVPAHRELDTGTLRAILRQASRFVPGNELRPHFYERADRVHDPEGGGVAVAQPPSIAVVSLSELVPPEWIQSPEAAVWLTCFQCLGVSEADLSPGLRYINLPDTRVVILYGQVPYMVPGELVIQSREHANYRFKPEITKTPSGAYTLIASPFDQADPDAVLRARSRADWAGGLLAAVIGRNAVYRRVFERVEWLNTKWEDYSGRFIRNPSSLPQPDVTNERLALCSTVYEAASKLDGIGWNRVQLSLRWFAQAFESEGIDQFLKYWVALEALRMSDDSNVRALKESLGRAYGIAPREAEARYGVGRILHFRSGIVHQGLTPSIHGRLMDYLEALYRDVLFERLGLRCEAAAESIRKQQGFDLRSLLGQISSPRSASA